MSVLDQIKFGGHENVLDLHNFQKSSPADHNLLYLGFFPPPPHTHHFPLELFGPTLFPLGNEDLFGICNLYNQPRVMQIQGLGFKKETDFEQYFS